MNIRKMWLFFFWMMPLLLIANCVVSVIFFKAAPLNASPFLLSQLKKLFETSFSSLVWDLLIDLPILYFCAYRKPGTKLLFLNILWSYVRIPLLILVLWAVYFKTSHMEYLNPLWNVRASRILIGSNLIAALHQIGWLYCCVRLRKDNLKNGYEKVVQNPTYKASLDQFQVMDDRESLTTFYSSAVKEFPEIEKYLTRAYKRQKLQLER